MSETKGCKRLFPIVHADWKELGDLSFLSISPNGGEFNLQWIRNLERESMSNEALSILVDQNFNEKTKKTHDLVFVRGDIFKTEDCHAIKAKEFAKQHRLDNPGLEVFPLLCELFSFQVDEFVRPSTVILMHKELKDKLGRPMQLSIDITKKSIRVGHYVELCEDKKFLSDVYFVFST